MKLLQVLGTGCAKCAKLKEQAEAAVKELGIEATVEKVEDISVITGFAGPSGLSVDSGPHAGRTALCAPSAALSRDLVMSACVLPRPGSEER